MQAPAPRVLLVGPEVAQQLRPGEQHRVAPAPVLATGSGAGKVLFECHLRGTPELAQKGYQLGIVVLLEDPDTLTKFLEDPLHKQFTDKLADYWERPVVYDFVREKEIPMKVEPKKKDTKKKPAE